MSSTGVSWLSVVSGGGRFEMQRCITWYATVFWVSGVVLRVSNACVSLMVRDLLTVAILVRMCWRCVVSFGLSLMYMYKFLVVLESWTYIRG